MKILFVLLLLLVCSPGIYSQEKWSALIDDKQFDSLIWLAGRDRNVSLKAEPFILHFNGDFNGAASSAGRLLKQRKITDTSLIRKYYQVQAFSLINLHRYRDGLVTLQSMLSDRRLDTISLAREMNSTISMMKAIASVPPQSVDAFDSATISVVTDLAGLFRLPVSVGDSTFEFIFDTGANFSVITESNAKKAGVTVFDSGFHVNSASGIGAGSKAGFAPAMKIGNIVIRNVVLLVMPDSALSFAKGLYTIPGIIGLPVISALNRYRFSGGGKCSIYDSRLSSPNIATSTRIKSGRVQNSNRASQESNMFYDGFGMAVLLKHNGKLTPWFFDSGAQTSALFVKAEKDAEPYKKNESIETVGSAGGSVNIKVFKLSEFPVSFDTTLIKLRNVNLYGAPVPNNSHSRDYYGTIGLDVIRMHRTVEIDFGRRRISLN